MSITYVDALLGQKRMRVHSVKKLFIRIMNFPWFRGVEKDVRYTPVLATWIIRSKTSTSRRRKILIPCLQTQAGRCTIRCRQQQTLARTMLFSRNGEASFMVGIFTSLQRLKEGCLEALTSHFARWTKPLRTSLPLSTLNDLSSSRSQLIAENALLRQQLIMLKRQVKRPTCTKTDRLRLVLLARLVRTWQQAHITRATRNNAAASIGSSFAGIGGVSPRPLLTSPRSPQKRSP